MIANCHYICLNYNNAITGSSAKKKRVDKTRGTLLLCTVIMYVMGIVNILCRDTILYNSCMTI